MKRSPRVAEAAEKLYQQLLDAGVEVLFDDRKERPGVMFADHELMGTPTLLIIGERNLDNEQVEVKNRITGEKSLIAIDLKLGEFDAAYKGEMELYLGYLEKHEMMEDENHPIGLILCTGKNPEHIELLQLHKTNIKVADYFTILPAKEVLLDRLHKAIEIAKNQIENRR